MSEAMLGKATESEESSKSITPSSSTVPNIPYVLQLNDPRHETHPFVCYRCSKRFASTHALGGHQNAHKKERDEERRLYVQQRLASTKQSPTIAPQMPTPLTVVHPAQPAVINNPVPPLQRPTHGFMLLQPLAAGGFVFDGPQAQFFVPAGFVYGPKRSEVKVGEALCKTSDHQENQFNDHPYKNPADKQSMPSKLHHLYTESGFLAKAGEESGCSNLYSASTTTATGPYAAEALVNADHHNTSKEEELDLTLRL